MHPKVVNKPAYAPDLLVRPKAMGPPNKTACFPCWSAACHSFNPAVGVPFTVKCRFTETNSVLCGLCNERKDTCEAVPGLMEFDEIRVIELLKAAESLFEEQATSEEDTDESVDEDDRVFDCPMDIRCAIATVQLRLVVAFVHSVSEHAKSHHINVPLSARGEAAIKYNNAIHQRDTQQRGGIAPIKSNSSETVKAKYQRLAMLRMNYRDKGFQHWSSSVLAFREELRRACGEEWKRKCEEALKKVEEDVFLF